MVGSGPIGFASPSRFKTLDSQAVKKNIGPVPLDVHEISEFQKRCRGFLTVCVVFSAWARPHLYFRGFLSKAKICATKSYADS